MSEPAGDAGGVPARKGSTLDEALSKAAHEAAVEDEHEHHGREHGENPGSGVLAVDHAERRVGRDQLTAWEQRLARQRAEIEAGERRLERLRAAHKAGSAVVAGGLRLVGEPERSFAPQARGALGNVGSAPTDGDGQ